MANTRSPSAGTFHCVTSYKPGCAFVDIQQRRSNLVCARSGPMANNAENDGNESG